MSAHRSRFIDRLSSMQPERRLFLLTGLGGLVGALTYATGDILMHGLSADFGDFPAVAAYADTIDDMVKMLALSEERLFAGSLGVLYLAPFYLAGVWHVYLALRPAGRRTALPPFLLLFWVYALCPLVHGMFYGLGESLFALNEVVAEAQPRIAELYHRQAVALIVVYVPVLLAAFVGWGWVSVAIARGRTLYPRWMAVVNPMALFFLFLCLGSSSPGFLGLSIRAASTNLGGVIFFSLSTWILWSREENPANLDP